MDDLIAILPLALFTLFAVMYHIGREEYNKQSKDEKEKLEEIVENRSTRITFILIFSVLVFFLIFSMVYDDEYFAEREKQKIEKNSYIFNRGSSLICSFSKTDNQENYLINKRTGWTIYKNSYFRKDDLLLKIDMCK